MYKSYMDESGVQDPKAVVVAGYLGTDTQLDRLAREWEVVLSKPEYDMLEEGFHAREFYNPSPKSKVFQWRQTKRDQFVDELLGVIEDRRVWLFGTGVDSEAFNRLTEGEKRHLTGGVLIGPSGKWKISGKASAPYFLALRNQLETVVVRTPRGQKCYQILSRQEQYEGYAHSYYDWLCGKGSPLKAPYDKGKLGQPLVFGSPKQYLQLQAADLAAYHIYQYTLERRTQGKPAPTQLFMRIIDRIQSLDDLRIVTADTLPKLVATYREYEPHWTAERQRRARLHGRQSV